MNIRKGESPVHLKFQERTQDVNYSLFAQDHGSKMRFSHFYCLMMGLLETLQEVTTRWRTSTRHEVLRAISCKDVVGPLWMAVLEHLRGHAVADPTEPGEDADSMEQLEEGLGSMNRERS